MLLGSPLLLLYHPSLPPLFHLLDNSLKFLIHEQPLNISELQITDVLLSLPLLFFPCFDLCIPLSLSVAYASLAPLHSLDTLCHHGTI